jgi:hypothetical protein
MKINKLVKVADSFTINRYENGFMVEFSGRTQESDYKTVKIICTNTEHLFELIEEYNKIELDN